MRTCRGMLGRRNGEYGMEFGDWVMSVLILDSIHHHAA